MKKLIYILLFAFPFFGFAQQDLILASIQQANVCSPDANEVFTTANAASDPNCNEANATTDLYTIGTSSTIESVSTDDPVAGAYAIKGTCGGGAIQYIGYSFSITSGDTFTVSFWAKSTQGTLDRITAWTNLSGGPSSVNPPSTWTFYTYNVTASVTGTAILRFYAASSTSGVLGDNIFVDDLSIIKTS